MAYKIQRSDGYHEVRIWGTTSKYEVLTAVRELDRLDRGKTMPEIWLVAEESQVPFHHFREIAEAVKTLFPPGAVGKKTAIVAGGPFHKAQLELYRIEASMLPFEVQVFLDADEARAWIMART